jgi:PAS domain S-box-containing protein
MPADRKTTSLDAALRRGEHLFVALEELPVPVWVADRFGQLRWLNRAATALLASKAGSHFSDYVAPDSVAEAREVFARKVQGSHDSAVQWTTLITSVGLATVELASVPIRDGAEVVGVLALVRDERHVSSGRRRPKPRLTPRQQEVLELLADGRSTAEMAQRLGLSEETVRNHVRYLLAELRVRTRLEAVVTAFRNEWL